MEKEYMGNVPLIVYVPNNTVKVEIKATLIDDKDHLEHAVCKMSAEEVAEARINGNEWEAENVKYTLTDEGREFVEKLLKSNDEQ